MGYRFFRQIVYWCKKQGNKFHQKGKCNSPIFSTLRLRHMLFSVKCAKYRTTTLSLLMKLVSLLFTPVYYLLSDNNNVIKMNYNLLYGSGNPLD